MAMVPTSFIAQKAWTACWGPLLQPTPPPVIGLVGAKPDPSKITGEPTVVTPGAATGAVCVFAQVQVCTYDCRPCGGGTPVFTKAEFKAGGKVVTEMLSVLEAKVPIVVPGGAAGMVSLAHSFQTKGERRRATQYCAAQGFAPPAFGPLGPCPARIDCQGTEVPSDFRIGGGGRPAGGCGGNLVNREDTQPPVDFYSPDEPMPAEIEDVSDSEVDERPGGSPEPGSAGGDSGESGDTEAELGRSF